MLDFKFELGPLRVTFHLAQPAHEDGSEYVDLACEHEQATDEYEPDDEVGFRGTRRT